jgi:hypothetical protein
MAKEGRSETRGRARQNNNLAPRTGKKKIWRLFKSTFFKFFVLGEGWQEFLRARAKSLDNFHRKLFLLWKTEFTSARFTITSVTS